MMDRNEIRDAAAEEKPAIRGITPATCLRHLHSETSGSVWSVVWTVEDTILVIVSSPVSSITHPVSVFGVFLLIVTSSDRDQQFVISGGRSVEKI